MALASTDDVAVPLLRALTAEETAYAAKLLTWAEALVKAESVRRGTTLDALDVDAVKMVEASAVARVLRNPGGTYQESLSGEYSATRDRLLSDGVLRIADDEWSLLFPEAPAGGAFSVDTAPATGITGHSPWCSLYYGGTTCSCGANLTGYQYPIYEPDTA